jgi:hypothetical protein
VKNFKAALERSLSTRQARQAGRGFGLENVGPRSQSLGRKPGGPGRKLAAPSSSSLAPVVSASPCGGQLSSLITSLIFQLCGDFCLLTMLRFKP